MHSCADERVDALIRQTGARCAGIALLEVTIAHVFCARPRCYIKEPSYDNRHRKMV